MATYSRKSSSGPVLGFRRSSSPSGRFSSSPSASSSGFASSSFSSRSTGFFQAQRSTSPTRVNMYASGFASSAPSVSFSILDRSISPSRSISAAPRDQVVRKQSHPLSSPQKRTCMCSPTNHPGSFRCALHKNHSNNNQAASRPWILWCPLHPEATSPPFVILYGNTVKKKWVVNSAFAAVLICSRPEVSHRADLVNGEVETAVAAPFYQMASIV